MKELKTYAHLYLGCEVRVRKRDDWSKPFNVGRICEVTRRSNHGDWIKVWFDDVITVTNETLNELTSNAHHYFINQDEIKLILRPMSDMTEEEGNKFFRHKYRESSVFDWFNCINVTNAGCEFETIYTSESRKRRRTIPWDSLNGDDFHYLLSRGFDLFGLLESGLAVSKTETK